MDRRMKARPRLPGIPALANMADLEMAPAECGGLLLKIDWLRRLVPACAPSRRTRSGAEHISGGR